MTRPLVLLAPGAGAPSISPWMQGWKARLASLGDVVAFDYPYMKEGRRSPDRPPVLLAAHRTALAEARTRFPGAPVLAGKSMGGRIGCHLALEVEVRALVCLGYPLVGANGSMRDEVLMALRAPILFVQGTRDRLCPLERLADVRRRMKAPNELFVVEGGDHSLLAARKALAAAGETQERVDGRILDAIRGFLGAHGLAAGS
jgi:predicted alpha/beta-hydrolase family hydrolase